MVVEKCQQVRPVFNDPLLKSNHFSMIGAYLPPDQLIKQGFNSGPLRYGFSIISSFDRFFELNCLHNHLAELCCP